MDAVSSTNDVARELALAGDPGSVAIVARSQYAGRGRKDRIWLSEHGGLYLSALVRPPRVLASRAGLVPLAAGLAVAETVEGLGLRPELRWPNDVWLRGRKLAGVLCESRVRPSLAESEPSLLEWVVVGMGINVAQSPGSLAQVGGTSLADALGNAPVPAEIVGPLLQHLERRLAEVESDPGGVVAAWASRAPMLGSAVRLETATGRLAGIAKCVEPTGALLVTLPDGDRSLTEGEVVRVG